MEKILVAAILFAAFCSPAVSLQRGKERLRELAVMPKLNFGIAFRYNGNESLSDLIEERDPNDRIATLKAELKQQPDDPQKQIQLGRLLDENSETNAANACFEKAVRLCRNRAESHPQDGLILTLLGDALFELGKKDEAFSVYRNATIISSNEWKCWTALGGFLDARAWSILQPDSKRTTTDFLSPKILNYRPSSENMEISQKLGAEASVCFNRAGVIAPKEAEVFLQRAWHCCASNFAASVVDSYSKEGKSVEPSVLSSIFSKTAIPDLEKAAELYPKSYRLLGLVAWFEWVSSQVNWANPSSLKVVELSDLPLKSRESILNVIRRLKAIAEGNDEKLAAGASETLGMIKILTKHDSDSVSADFRRAVSLDPARNQSWDILAGMAVQANSKNELVTICESRLKYKRSARNHLLLAKALARDNQFNKAEDEARAALKLETNNVPVHLMLAAMLIRQDKDSATIETLLTHTGEMLKEMPDSDEKSDRVRELLLSLAIVSALDDDNESAKSFIETVLKERPDDEQAKPYQCS